MISLSLGMLLSACSSVPTGTSQLDVGIEDRGVASWYGESFHGKQAANGELFDMEAFTRLAIRTLPRQRGPSREFSERETSPLRITDRVPMSTAGSSIFPGARRLG